MSLTKIFNIRPSIKSGILIVAMTLLAGSGRNAFAGIETLENRVAASERVFSDFTRIPAQGIPHDFLQKARVILIFPNYVKGGYLYAGKFGLGIVMIKSAESGLWSPPAFVRLGGMSFGLQAGIQWTDLILVGKGDPTVLNFLNHKMSLGGSASAAAGPWGRHTEFNADWLMRSSLFAYSRSKGLFASVATDGTALSFDDDHNRLFYGPGATGRDVLFGQVNLESAAAKNLMQTVSGYTQSLALPAALTVESPSESAPQTLAAPKAPDSVSFVDQKDHSVVVVKNAVQNIKLYFDYNDASLREDTTPILDRAARALKKNPRHSIVISGRTDVRGASAYNEKLGKNRAQSVARYLEQKGVSPDRIQIVSRGEIDAMAPASDLLGMQKDRNAHFVVAELERQRLPEPPKPRANLKFEEVGERIYVGREERNIESASKVSSREYVVKEGDSLSRIAQREMGGAHRWPYLQAANTQRLSNPEFLRSGQRLLIPIE